MLRTEKYTHVYMHGYVQPMTYSMGCDSLTRKPLLLFNHVVNGVWLCCPPSPSPNPGAVLLMAEHFMSCLLLSCLRGEDPSIIQCLQLVSKKGCASHRFPVPRVASVSLSAFGVAVGCCRSVFWVLSVASGMHSFCHDPCSPALGEASAD